MKKTKIPKTMTHNCQFTADNWIPTAAEAFQLLEQERVPPNVIKHVKCVLSVAESIIEAIYAHRDHGYPESQNGPNMFDRELVIAGSILHDIGRSRTHGLLHALEGARICRKYHMDPRLVMIVRNHIGGGILRDEALALGLPEKDYRPKTIEEKIVAHADNLVADAKTVPVSYTVERLRSHGISDGAERVIELHNELSGLCGFDLDLI